MGRRVTAASLAPAVALAAALAGGAPIAQAQTVEVREAELHAVAIDLPQDHWSAGTMTIGTEPIVIPRLLLVALPGAALTLQELFALAPPRCRDRHETGLARTDACRRPAPDATGSSRPPVRPIDTTPRISLDPPPSYDPPVGIVRITAARTSDGRLVAREVALTKGRGTVSGAVTFVDLHHGYLRIGGPTGLDAGGTLVRLNDPAGRHSTQQGPGCSTEGNCSPDARFRLDPLRETVRFAAGPAACVPSDSPGDLCSRAVRPLTGPAACVPSDSPGDLCSRAVRPLTGPADPAALVPIESGDHVTASGHFEVVDGIRIFWVHTLIVETSPF